MTTRVTGTAILAAAGLAALLMTAAAAQQNAANLSDADRAFIKEAAQGGMAEVQLGQLAEKKGANAAVKQFGQQMVRDHSQANSELKQLATKKGLTLPTDVGEKHRSMAEHLAKLSGAAFDRAYMSHMVMDHNHDVASFRKESQSASDPDLKAWAGKTLPTLQQHLRLARETASTVGAGNRGTATRTSTTTRTSGGAGASGNTGR